MSIMAFFETSTREVIVRPTHRGLWYEDGVFVRILEPGRYVRPRYINLGFWRRKKVGIILVDVRERELTIKGQEILTGDKVAIRVSIIVQFRVADSAAAVHAVESFEERLYSDVQLAARRSLATMTLEEILTNRNRLSDDILRDVKEAARGYGISILRADVKDLAFPGNLQEIMNRVLAAERMSQAQLVEARTKAEVQKIEAQARAEAQRMQDETEAQATRRAAELQAELQHVKTEADVQSLRQREEAARAYSKHPALLRLQELETLRELGKNGNARIYIGFDKHFNGQSKLEE